MRVVLARTAAAAQQFATENLVAATVEAEYGEVVIEGTKVTLAHHTGAYKGQQPPSARTDVPVLGDKDIALISHIDGDTVGGLAALTGSKPQNVDFWKAIAFLDEKGPHHLHEIEPETRRLVTAYWGFSLKNRFFARDDITDVTNEVKKHIAAFKNILGGDQEFISSCLQACVANEGAVERCLKLEEVDTTRVFVSDGPFCNGAYYSPKLNRIIPSVVSWNIVTGAITVSFSDGGRKHSACKIVQSLWGSEAGGHDGIAGSPRGKQMTSDDLNQVATLVQERLRSK